MSESSLSKRLWGDDAWYSIVDDWFYKHFKPQWRVAHKVFKFIRDIPYEISCLISPRNRVTAHFLSRHYHDTDVLMFHVNFQLLVDFVEQGKEMLDFNDPQYNSSKRYTDINRMYEWVELNFSPSRIEENYADDFNWDDEEYRQSTIKHNNDRYHQLREILFIYNWYKNVWPNTPDLMPYRASEGSVMNGLFEKLKTEPHKTVYLNGGSSYDLDAPVITFKEWMELEEELQLVEDNMLHRLMNIRRILWT